MTEETKYDKIIEDFLKVPHVVEQHFESMFKQIYGDIMQADIDKFKESTVDETISMAEIERIKEKLKNVGIEFQSSGKNLSMLCPFHQEKTPSMMYSSKEKIFHCFGCGSHLNEYDFFQEVAIRENLARFPCEISNKEIVDQTLSIAEIEEIKDKYY